MKLFFLLFVYLLMLSVYAQREFIEYTCLVTHENERTPFYLKIGEKKKVEIGENKVQAELNRKEEMIEIALSRTITEASGSTTRLERKLFPSRSRKLTVELFHETQDKEDHFLLECSPRDP